MYKPEKEKEPLAVKADKAVQYVSKNTDAILIIGVGAIAATRAIGYLIRSIKM